MDVYPKFGIKRTLVGYEKSWKFKRYRCRLSACEENITVNILGGVETFGAPGEEIIFLQKVSSLENALEIIQGFPERFGPESCTKLGFQEVNHVIFN